MVKQGKQEPNKPLSALPKSTDSLFEWVKGEWPQKFSDIGQYYNQYGAALLHLDKLSGKGTPVMDWIRNGGTSRFQYGTGLTRASGFNFPGHERPQEFEHGTPLFCTKDGKCLQLYTPVYEGATPHSDENWASLTRDGPIARVMEWERNDENIRIMCEEMQQDALLPLTKGRKPGF